MSMNPMEFRYSSTTMSDYSSDSDAGSIESTTSVLLGFTDGAIRAKDEAQQDILTNKIGGRAAFAELPLLDDGRCGACRQLMPLLVQISAPLTEEEAEENYGKQRFERLLYVFACMRKACQGKDESIKAFRVLLPIPDKVETAKPEKKVDTLNPFATKQTNSQSDNDFSSNLFSDDSFENAFASSEVPQPPKTEKQNCPVLYWDEESPVLPAQYLNSEYEIRSCEDQDAAATLASRLASTSLLPESSAPKPMPKGQGIRRNASKADAVESGSPADGNWAGESYESQTIDGIDDAYLHFQERVLVWGDGENASQVMRYHRHGKPLPFTSKGEAYDELFPQTSADKSNRQYDASQLPKCQNCGGTSTFELQIMPQLIAVLSKSGPLKSDAEGNEFSWSTIWCFFCSKDCRQEGGATWLQGSVRVQQEL